MSMNQKLGALIGRSHRLFLRYAQTHPGSLTIGILAGSTIVGVGLFKLMDDDVTQYKRDPKQKMSLEEARLVAMLENAKQSSWQENLDNAVEAQEKFMLPNSQRDAPTALMDSIDQRSKEILKNQHDKVDKERTTKESTIFWN